MFRTRWGFWRDFFIWNVWIMLDRLKVNNSNKFGGFKMRVIELNKKESVKEVTLERAKELLNNKSISDEDLKKLMNNLRAFCRIVIEIRQSIEQKNNSQNSFEELKEAA